MRMMFCLVWLSYVTASLAAQSVSNMTVASGSVYALQPSAAISQPAYIDRGYTLTSVPSSVLNRPYIKTANDDKLLSTPIFLSLDVDQAVTVMVAHDDRIQPKPAWMAAFMDTGDDVTTSASDRLSLFRKDFSSGRVVLGGNAGSSSSSMYLVFLIPSAAPPLPTLPPTPPPTTGAPGNYSLGVVVSLVGIIKAELYVNDDPMPVDVHLARTGEKLPLILEMTWRRSMPIPPGSYTFTVKAYDASGNLLTPEPMTLVQR